MCSLPIEKKYLELSQLYFPLTRNPVVKLLEYERPATAKLIELADKGRHLYVGMSNYDDFCQMLRSNNPNALPAFGAFNIDGKSADWVTAFQVTVNTPSTERPLEIYDLLTAIKEWPNP